MHHGLHLSNLYLKKNPKVVSLTHLKGHRRGLSLLILLLYLFVIYGRFLFTVRMFCNFPASSAMITCDAYRISIITLYAKNREVARLAALLVEVGNSPSCDGGEGTGMAKETHWRIC